MEIIEKRVVKMSGISEKLLQAYISWQNNNKHVPKMLRYSMGVRIDTLFAQIIELVSEAMFVSDEQKLPLVRRANVKNDVLKFMVYALLELGGLKESIFIELSLKTEEVGKMLYGWRIKLEKQNRPNAVKTTSVGNDKK
jgi:hypothetical protein